MDTVIAQWEMGVVSWRQYGALNTLIMGCRDAGRTYRTASEIVSNAEHRKRLGIMCNRRSTFVEDLSRFAGGRSGVSWIGSAVGVLRWTLRWFLTLEGAHDGDTFRECANVEARVLRLYARALRRAWPPEMRAILNEQVREIEMNYDQMRALRGLH